jgi:hypothetical protein
LVAEHEEGPESCSATLQVKLITLRSDLGNGAIANQAQKTRTEVTDRSRVDSQDILINKLTVWCLGLPTERLSGGLLRLLCMLVGELDIEDDPATYSRLESYREQKPIEI